MLLGVFLLNLSMVAISKAVRASLPDVKTPSLAIEMMPFFIFALIVCWFGEFKKRMATNQKLGWVIFHRLLPCMLIDWSVLYSIRVTLPHDMLTITYAALATLSVVTILTLLAVLVILILNNIDHPNKI
jgi:hypothetical protein